MNAKQQAAEAALEYVQSGMTLGLGTGSTADYFLTALGAALNSGKLSGIQGVPTSNRSAERASELGIPLVSSHADLKIDLTIDGADEVSDLLDLIKGLGGALLREKIVAQNSRRLIIIADQGKRVATLGTHVALPIEVTPFGHDLQPGFLEELGGQAVLRRGSDGKSFVTDNGNFIYDTRFARIDRPAELQHQLKMRAGIVETGLFVGMASMALIGTDDGIQTLKR